MTTDEYLKTCTNVPALPSGWMWRTQATQKDREVKTGTKNFTYIDIEIVNRDEVIQGRHLVVFHTANITKYPEVLNIELAEGFRTAYNSLYSERKLNLYTVLDLDTTL